MIAIIIEDSLIQAINYPIGSQPKVNDENLTDIQRYKLRFPPPHVAKKLLFFDSTLKIFCSVATR